MKFIVIFIGFLIKIIKKVQKSRFLKIKEFLWYNLNMNELEFLTYIKRKRKEKNILVKDMAMYLNVSKSYYSRIENSKIKLSFKMIKIISEILDIDLNIIKDINDYNKVFFYD